MKKQVEVKYYIVDHTYLYCCSNYRAFQYILEEKGKWIECDYITCVADYLNGFDETEPVDSPYRFGNNSISQQIQEVSEKVVISKFGKNAVLDTIELFK